MFKSEILKKCEALREKIQAELIQEEKNRNDIIEKLSLAPTRLYKELVKANLASQVKFNIDLLEIAKQNNS